ncbi:hypothetical protein [Stieleria mannarensis]|uniref:hypothetical protein n=1 Tax=Stieleria mannarensis TaxID=2755585 RepID=UPI001602936D|nr:hypothetical protein [Rhodopirellula sp. JC639]
MLVFGDLSLVETSGKGTINEQPFEYEATKLKNYAIVNVRVQKLALQEEPSVLRFGTAKITLRILSQ